MCDGSYRAESVSRIMQNCKKNIEDSSYFYKKVGVGGGATIYIYIYIYVKGSAGVYLENSMFFYILHYFLNCWIL